MTAGWGQRISVASAVPCSHVRATSNCEFVPYSSCRALSCARARVEGGRPFGGDGPGNRAPSRFVARPKLAERDFGRKP